MRSWLRPLTLDAYAREVPRGEATKSAAQSFHLTQTAHHAVPAEAGQRMRGVNNGAGGISEMGGHVDG
jgi:hypothetical protein